MSVPEAVNYQNAPYPQELLEVVQNAEYRPGWTFTLVDMERDPGCEGLTLEVRSVGYDSYHPENGRTYGVKHRFSVPAATYNLESWQEWMLEILIKIESHEACEFFKVNGKRPFAPNHGPGWNPYVVRTLNRVEDAETRFTGERVEGSQA